MTWNKKPPPGPSRRAVLGLIGSVPVAAATQWAGTGPAVAAGPAEDLAARIQEIIHRPVFADSEWGMAFAAPDTGEVVYAISPGELFVAASSFKVFIAGIAFETLGAGHRFRTRIYRTGPVVHGVLRGDLVLVAGGDLLLSGRMRRDGALILPDPDPTYPGGTPLPDPLREIRGLARQIGAAGIRRVDGRIIVDTSLFAEARESIAIDDTQITVSPMMINDHVVHAAVSPGTTADAPATVSAKPATGYVRFASQVTTVAGSGALPLTVGGDVTNPDGTHTVTITGDIPVGSPPQFVPYYVPNPAQFAGTVLAEALHDQGVRVSNGVVAPGSRHARGVLVAEHLSPPLADESKVMLKVSSNVHAVTFPYLVGAIAGRDPDTPKATYEQYRRELFRAAGIDPDPDGAAQGAYCADTFIKFLSHVQRKPYFAPFRQALPIMGRDGTLAGNQPGSPAAGHVFAKTGTAMAYAQGGGAQVHKALAGYIQLPDGRWLTFAQFMRQAATPETAMSLTGQAQESMAEIATAVYETLGRTSR